MRVSEDLHSEYMTAYSAWLERIEAVHKFFFEESTLRPDKVKGLLNREANAKSKYDLARLRLLGLDSNDAQQTTENQ
jgi:hypothetical protein|tara:strand:+ start:444 stop:674 length:231 start_codon:yes stop_codon:yes gene_type:complete